METQKQEKNKEVMENKEIKVTKQKNPKRVEIGKKLVEWNKQNKEKIAREKLDREKLINQAIKIDSADSSEDNNSGIGSNNYLFGGGIAGVVLLIGGAYLYFRYNHKQPPALIPITKITNKKSNYDME